MEIILQIGRVAPGRYQLEIARETTVGEAQLALQHAAQQIASIPLLPHGESEAADGGEGSD